MSAIENRLGEATSPYLRQHKDNPVAWQPWDNDVLELAKQQDKPILLSIGYSACHWCHVMAHESFEDEGTAHLMNSMFINIKVDREERPDIDNVYQTAHQLLTGRSGGWPLTVFLCPRTNLPFLVGTYFPKKTRGGQIGFQELLVKVNDYYHTRGKDFLETLDQVKHSYKVLTEKENRIDADINLDIAPLEQATQKLLQSADTDYGGFGSAPKFFMPNNLERLFFASLVPNKWQQPASQHLRYTLSIMAHSGINDLIGGGFFRYATDDRWMIPHFEKMLYDNGQLLALYAQGFNLFKDADLEQAAIGIARWALEDMRHPDGAFYGSLDADSGGLEGGYYLWQASEINGLLTREEGALVHACYELDKYPNFEDLWHLHRERRWQDIIDELEIDNANARALLAAAHKKLLTARQQRPSPGLDNKILTSWNGLMIRGLAIAARAMANKSYLQAAQKAVDFIRNNLWINRRLFASWQNGQAKLVGYLDDYVFLMDGLLELLRMEWRDEDYRFLSSLAESLIENFEDKDSGGFYFTAHDAEELIHRSKPAFDNVVPSGNGVAAKVFGRMGHLCAEPRYLESAQRALHNHWPSVLNQPQGHHNLLLALEEFLAAPVQVLLKGDDTLAVWQKELQQEYGELVHCYHVPSTSDIHPPELFLLEDNQGVVCLGDHCLEPQDTLQGVLDQLGKHFAAKFGWQIN